MVQGYCRPSICNSHTLACTDNPSHPTPEYVDSSFPCSKELVRLHALRRSVPKACLCSHTLPPPVTATVYLLMVN